MTSTDTFAPNAVAGLSAYEAACWMGDAVRRLGSGLRHLTGGGDGSLGLGDVLALVPTDDLAGLFGDLVALRALAEGASAAVLAEAVSRGVVAASDESPRPIGPKVTAWVQEQAAAAGAPVTAGVAGTYRTCWEQSRRPELAPLTAAVRAGRISLAVGARLGADLSTLAVKIPTDWWDAAAGELIAHAATGASASQLGSLKEALIANCGEEGDFEEQQKVLHRQRRFTTPVKDGTGMWVGRYAMTGFGGQGPDHHHHRPRHPRRSRRRRLRPEPRHYLHRLRQPLDRHRLRQPLDEHRRAGERVRAGRVRHSVDPGHGSTPRV
ncbi:MAG: hypothetical protein LCH98_08870 [Actinobacteria bacterium]|nr:hypothetical protein [Actinomycetota bacterium]